ncbi:MAG: hypothetical protein AAGD14_05815 [Planctomycetota bacterium]
MTLLLLATLVLPYEGKYADDARLAAAVKELPAQLAAARKLVGEKTAVRIRLVDGGKARGGVVARTRREPEGFVITLYTEALVLRAHAPISTLAHELIHVRQKSRWSAREAARRPPWVVEGMAIYLAGQLEQRARVLAAHVGRERVPADAVSRLVNGLEGRHTLLDYFEDGAAFAHVEEQHGKEKVDAFIEALLAGQRARTAVRSVLGQRWESFERGAREHAIRTIRPLIENGRPALLGRRRALLEERWDDALEGTAPNTVYDADFVYVRARALAGLGRPQEALQTLRRQFLDQPVREATILATALRFEAKLEPALAARLKLDLP